MPRLKTGLTALGATTMALGIAVVTLTLPTPTQSQPQGAKSDTTNQATSKTPTSSPPRDKTEQPKEDTEGETKAKEEAAKKKKKSKAEREAKRAEETKRQEGASEEATESHPPEPEPEQMTELWAEHATLDDHAHDDGSLNCWYDGYYVAHNWSDPGKVITGLQVGDEILLDGSRFSVEGIDYQWGDDCIYEDVRAKLGGEVAVMQTCGEDGYLKLAYGHHDGHGNYRMVISSTSTTTYDEYADESITYETVTYEEDTTSETSYCSGMIGYGDAPEEESPSSDSSLAEGSI